MELEGLIREKARELGIHRCGVIKPEALLDYADRLQERMDLVPKSEAFYKGFLRFADIRRQFPWAKSVIVAALHYGRYRIPAPIKPYYGKYYLMDMRLNPQSPETLAIQTFEEYLRALGLRIAGEILFGVTALRWAAYKAGLGIIRRNNFFYTDKGSWVTLAAWVTDQTMELISSPGLRECPPNCDQCIQACPTKSLFQPYAMNPGTCVSRLTTAQEPLAYDRRRDQSLGTWLYGCDACQDACPMNKDMWEETDDFPGLNALGEHLLPERVLAMEYGEIKERLLPKFFYIREESLWRWKLNAIHVMVNEYQEAYAPYLVNALRDEYPPVREKAQCALGILKCPQSILQ